MAAVRGKEFWKLGKGECAVLKANEKSVSSLIPSSVLSKLGIVSFSVVLISAILKRMVRDLKEVRGGNEYENNEPEDTDDLDDEDDPAEKRAKRF